MNPKLLLCLALGLVFSSAQPAQALSSSEQITTNDLPKIHAFIKIEAQTLADGDKQFKVMVTPYDGAKPENVFGCLDVYQHGKLVVHCRVSSRKLAALEKEADGSVKGKSIVFEFTVAQAHLADSRFAVNQSYPEASAFDEHWFYLKDFADTNAFDATKNAAANPPSPTTPDLITAKESRTKKDWDYDGRRILGHIGNDVCLWDAADGRLLKKFVGHGEKIAFVQFSPDGKYVMSCSGAVPEDGLVPESNIHIISKDTSTRIWDVDTGKQLHCLTHQMAAGFDPSGKNIITYSEAGKGSNRFEAGIRETLTGRLISSSLLETYFSPQSSSLEFSPDGQSYVSVSGSDIILRAVSDGREIRRLLRTMRGHFRFVAHSSIFTIGGHEAAVWNLQTGQATRRIQVPLQAEEFDTRLSSDGRKFVGAHPKFFAVEMESGRLKQGAAPESGSSGISATLLSPDAKVFVIEWSNKDGAKMAELFDVESCEKIATAGLGEWGHIIAFSPDGATLLTGGSSFRIYASKNGKLLHEFKLLEKAVRSYEWSSGG